VKFCLPIDVVIAQEPLAGTETKICKPNEVPDNWKIFDVGPETIGVFSAALEGIKTVLWNGPMGIFEIPEFSKGTYQLADVIRSLPETRTIVGGGSTVEAIAAMGIEGEFTHVSTGGGASLEFLEGRTLPGIKPLYK
jgi:phosphoglycerate kinase